MFCPQCGSTQSDELKFCKLCGANLQAVRQAVKAGEGGFDWSKTWVAEMFMSGEEAAKREGELKRLRGITPEVERLNEIRAGVITASVGLGVTIFLFFLMQAIVLGGKVPDDTAMILSRVWIAGLIPLLIGLAIIFNGLVLSKKIAEIARGLQQDEPNALRGGARPEALRPADTTEFVPTDFSVTEETTMHLKNPGPKQ